MDMKAKVYLWTRDVKIVRMETDGRTGFPIEGVLENACTVMQAMMPTNDVEQMINLIVRTVRECHDNGIPFGSEMENHVYTAIMKESTFNK